MDNTKEMIIMFGRKYNSVTRRDDETDDQFQNRSLKNTHLTHQSQILDVLIACFEKEAQAWYVELRNYPRKIMDVEDRAKMLSIRCGDDDEAYFNAYRQLDKQRTNCHNAALVAAQHLNDMCDDLHIEHLFKAELSSAPGKRTVAGEEILDFVAFFERKEAE